LARAVHVHRHSTATKVEKEHKMKATYLKSQFEMTENVTDEVNKPLQRYGMTHLLHEVLSDIPSKRIFFVPGKRKLQQVSTIT
jgi:hypothetical protein